MAPLTSVGHACVIELDTGASGQLPTRVIELIPAGRLAGYLVSCRVITWVDGCQTSLSTKL